jgi:hypothetical protein
VNRLRIHHFVAIGLGAWGAPASLLFGPWPLLLAAFVVLPLWLSWRSGRLPELGGNDYRAFPVFWAALLVVGYVLVDGQFGRAKWGQNLFLSRAAIDATISLTNEAESQGRGIVELVGLVIAFLPLALFDVGRKLQGTQRYVLWSTGGLLLFYEVGISRGHLLMAVAAILLGGGIGWRRGLLAAGASLAAFGAASYFRGDFGETTFGNPLFDAVAWPYINLAGLVNADCGGASWLAFSSEFIKKFLPAFLVSKEVFSFNVEMSRCIYPVASGYVEAVSVFTYLGELYYYSPGLLVAFMGGLFLSGLALAGEFLFGRSGLHSTRLFVGFMCINLLRSRILDVASFLIALILFLLLWRLLGWADDDGESSRRTSVEAPSAEAGAPDSGLG